MPGTRPWLTGAAILLLLARAGDGAPPDEPRLIGIVELPGLFGVYDADGAPGTVPPAIGTPVPLHAEPHAESPRIAAVDEPDSVEWREFAYEAPGALAYGAEAEWVRVALRSDEPARRYGWVPPTHRGPLHPLPRLLLEGLAYFTGDWDRTLRAEPRPDAASTTIGPPRELGSTDIQVLEAVEVDGATWLRVDVLGPGRCESADPPASVATGWLPMLADSGLPNAWFYSRGC